MRWFYRLNSNSSGKGLYDSYNNQQLQTGLIVCFINNRNQRLFILFQSHLHFGKHLITTPKKDQTFFEIIRGQYAQKPHFDLDFNLKDLPTTINPELVKDNLISAILAICKLDQIELNLQRHILLFTSHGEHKKSYHVIINGYCHNNNLEAKSFYDKVISLLSENEQKYIDHSVYGKSQNFRIVGSQKLNSNRPKILNTQWNYQGQLINYCYEEEVEDENHRLILELEASLITHVVDCLPLPSFVSQKVTIYNNHNSMNIDESIGRQGFMLLAEQANMAINDPRFPYEYKSITGNLIILKRIRPSICGICQRVHTNENPFMSVNSNNWKVYFHCRRSTTEKGLLIGTIVPENDYSVDEIFENLADYLPQNNNVNNTNNVIIDILPTNFIPLPNQTENKSVITLGQIPFGRAEKNKLQTQLIPLVKIKIRPKVITPNKPRISRLNYMKRLQSTPIVYTTIC